MTDSGSTEEGTVSSPGIGMRLCIAGISAKFPSVPNISTADLAQLMKNSSGQSADSGKLVILDTRPEEEYSISRIPGATRVDYTDEVNNILEAVPQLASIDSETKVVCYCSVGYRSSLVADKLNKFFENSGAAPTQPKVTNLEGSLFKWANENRPLVDEKGERTVYAHPYNAVYGKLLNSELRKSFHDNKDAKM
ncbi:uncharacterized protein LOC128232494 [Mya arenaria]|uniref:uncharacterized protein LOC128232494 n=1 Tax=Mya arenaria TaxID=6604 RepID=UPI0022E3A7A7|nr:uncharacterized protein LOC128232494 [Mya arenaria]